MMIVKMSVALVAVTFFASSANATLVSSWFQNPANDHWYALIDDMTWPDAQSVAESYDGYLVTINDLNEENWLVSTFGNDNTNPFWIGFTDRVSEGTWVWANGEAVTYVHWHAGEPNNDHGVEDYAVINYFQNFGSSGWTDLPNWDEHQGIIESPFSQPVPEPASMTLLGLGLVGVVATRVRKKEERCLTAR